jgi:crossover junction endodeoxyribonuclease RusA
MAREIVTDLFRDEPSRPNKRIYLTLPLPPSVNSAYVNTRYGGKRLSAKSERYVRDAGALINQFVDDQKWIADNKSTWYYLDIVFYFPDRKIRDSHNMLKILLDVMQTRVYPNDMYVMPRIQSVEYDKENPRLEAVVTVQSESSRKRGLHMVMS